MPRAILLFLLALAPSLLHANEAQKLLDELLSVRLDASRCWRVRDVFLEREDYKLYLNDGFLILAEPYRGRDVAALFIAKETTDFGELVLIPPSMGERESLARFTGETVLNERFRSALMLFTDDTAAALLKQLEESPSSKPDPAEGAALSERWSPVLRNILEGVAGRIMHDTLSNISVQEGFFAAAIGGGRHGRFDAILDPALYEQVSVGQTAWRAEQRFYEIWCQFPSRSVRSGKRERLRSVASLENYRLDVHLNPDLSMRVRAEADLVAGRSGYRTVDVEIASRLKVTSAQLDGAPIEFLQMDMASASASARRANSMVFLMLPAVMPQGARARLVLEYEGTVISRAGENVYFVGSRANWYPRAEPNFTRYEMTFHRPAHLDLAATGRLLEEGVEGDFRVSKFETSEPIRTAGFNLGQYAKATREVDGYTIEVLANRTIEERLRPRSEAIILPDLSGPRRRGGLRSTASVVVPSVVQRTPDPAARIEELADSDAEAFAFFRQRFGPPPTRHVVVSPIPAGFGQGFPGLVYAATLSYLSASDSPLDKLSESDRQFYLELLRPHEIAHQWWGNNVTIESAADLWIMEALATYSSLLFQEEKNGPEAMQTTLADFREHLLGKNQEGETIESAGPVSMGERLQMAKFPTAYRLMLYEKGAWIFHMLRGVLGDEQFFGLLTSLSEEFRLKELSTERLRVEAAKRLPKGYPDPELRDFFDQWVYGTGVPRLSVQFQQKAAGGKVLLEGVLQQRGVPEHFVIPVKLLAKIESGPPRETTVWTDGEETAFRLELPSKAVRVLIDPERRLLAAKE